MKLIVRPFVFDKQRHEQAARDAEGEAENVDEGVEPLAHQIAQRDGEIVFDGTPEALRVSEDPQVQSFLAPFQGSFEMVNRKRYVHGEIQERRKDRSDDK